MKSLHKPDNEDCLLNHRDYSVKLFPDTECTCKPNTEDKLQIRDDHIDVLLAEVERLTKELERVKTENKRLAAYGTLNIDRLIATIKAFMPLAESHYKRQNAEHKTFCDICRYWELVDAKLQGSNKE